MRRRCLTNLFKRYRSKPCKHISGLHPIANYGPWYHRARTWCVMKRLTETFDWTISILERISAFLACGAIAIIMVLVFADVISRQAFNIPLYFVNDLVTTYLFPFSVFSVLSLCFHKNYNVSIDVFSGVIPEKISCFYQAISNIAILLLFSALSYIYAKKMITSFVEDEMEFGMVSWIIWPMWAIVFSGSLLMLLRVLANTLSIIIHKKV